jgi:tetratricopeptide (TPR) repeat protein
MSHTIFLSTVTSEFGKLRTRLASLLGRTKRLHVRHEDDFVDRGVLTLQMLQEEIKASTLVIHVIGGELGSVPPTDQVDALLKRLPDFALRFPEAVECARQGQLTYTQWELWLAAYFDRKLCSYQIESRLIDKQRVHIRAMKTHERYAKKVSDDDELYDQVILTLIELQLLTQTEARRIIHLPYPSIGTLFKGREAFLSQLRESLKRNSKAKAINGLGGVGKTRLAVEYAWQHVDDYTAVLFVTADSPESLRRNIAELVGPKVLNLQEQSATEEEVREAAAIRWLQQNPGWCLILDNVDDEDTAEYVERLLSRLQGGDVLITSRLGRWSDSVEPLELDVLDDVSSANFLLEKTKPKGNRGRLIQTSDDEDAKQLAKELGGLALALEQAGSYIVQQRISLKEYLRLWRSKVPSVKEWHDDRMMKYPRSIAVTWQTTIDQLGKPERILLELLAWFAPEPVPLSVFGDYTLLSTDVNWGKDFPVAIGNLADYSMVRWNVEKNSVTVHRVVQEILRSRQLDAVENLKIVLRTIEAAIPKGDSSDVRMWPAWEPIQTHVEFATTEAEAKGIFSPTAKLMGQLGNMLFAKALHREAENLQRRALAIVEKEFGDQSTQVAVYLSNLAQTLQATNRLSEAEPLMRRALAIGEQSYGPDHPKVAIRLNNVALLLQATNRLSEAEPLMRRALAIDEQSYGPDHPNVAIWLNNVALLLQATNRLSEAEPLMRRALAIDEQSYGPDHPNVARDLNNLAQLLQATNRLSEAEPLMRRALAIDEQSFGPDHPNVAIRLNNVALLLQATNRLSEAEPLMRRALAIDEQSYGPDHPNVAIRLNNVALLLQATNRLSEAEPLMSRVVSIFEKSLGENHPNVATAVNNLALLLQATNRLSEAEPLMRRALAIDEQSYGPDHPAVARDLNNLAQLLQATNRLSEAELLMRRALAIDEQSYGPDHPDVAVDLNNLALLFQATNRLSEAEPLMRRALAIAIIFQKQTGHEHNRYQAWIRNYIGLLRAIELSDTEIEQRLKSVHDTFV